MTFEMKHIFKSITFGIALLAGTITAFAQGFDPDHLTETGVNVLKNVTGPDSNKDYTVTLETFAEGTTAVTSKSVPSDVILVLDVSSSMNNTQLPYGGYSTRLPALKDAVVKFAGSLYDNDVEATATDPQYAGNRIAIVTYNRNATMVVNWTDIGSGVVSKNAQGEYSGSLIRTINGITTGSGTRPDHGFEMVIEELLKTGGKRDGANLTVLMFTDGYPTDQWGTYYGENTDGQDVAHFDWPFANKTLYYASQIKKVYGAKLYSVGLISTVTRPNNPTQNGEWRYRNYCRVLQMMDWVSSNYPDADWTADTSDLVIEVGSYNGHNDSKDVYRRPGHSQRGDPDRPDVPLPWKNEWVYDASDNVSEGKYGISLAGFDAGTKASGDDVPEDGYSFIVDDDTSFDDIFETIANASGGSASPADQDTQIRDVVSNSFVLPEGFNEESLTICTWDIKDDASGWENETDVSDDVSITITTVTGSDGEERNELIVEGFDFSLDGEKDEHGYYTDPTDEGNWVGKRYTSQRVYHYAGKKLVISFKIKANGEATGGDGTNTNHPDSGVYLCVKDEEGNPILVDGKRQYEKVTSYPIPNTNLPLIIKITKDGLLHGESATFEIERCSPKKNADGTYVTNALGKPTPDGNWENWSKVILTNKGEDGDEVTKILYALDPAYVYQVTEDDWGWSYELTGTGSALNTSEVEVNPFNFHNTLKDGVVKHAEAVTINHFQGSESAAKEEHYKSVGKAQ